MKEKRETKRCPVHIASPSQKRNNGKVSYGEVRKKGKTRKHPLAPKKPRSAFILFSQHMHNEKDDKCKKMNQKVPRAAQHLSEVWKSMSLEERKTWKARAEKDKLRYKVELAMYSGPFTMPNFDNNGPKKDPSAPKRPMSAFLDYSKAFRGQVISENPHVTDNKEISKILGMMWNKASHEVKQPFIIKELALRAKYNEDIAQWRKERDDRIAAERSQRESIVHHAIETGTSDQIIRDAEDSRHLLQSRNATNSYEYTASIAFYPSCKTYYHGSEENSSTKFHQQPFDNEAGQPHYHAPCVLDDMHTNSNEGIRFSAKFEQLTDTFHQPYLEIGRCSAYDVYASSCFQERTQYNHISYICKERYGCSENGVGHLDCNSPFASNLPPLTSQLEPYPLNAIQAINSRERQDYPYNDYSQSIYFPAETPF